MHGTQELKITEVRIWRAVLRRAVAWKTARYIKGDIEATVVEIGEFEGLTDDPASGLVVTKGCLKVPSAPGLEVKINLSKARETTL
jgi:hypothetical protein